MDIFVLCLLRRGGRGRRGRVGSEASTLLRCVRPRRLLADDTEVSAVQGLLGVRRDLARPNPRLEEKAQVPSINLHL